MVKFEAFYDEYTEQWSVRKRRAEICVIYPCISEDMANEFAKLLNELNDENMRLKGENAHYKFLLMSLEEAARKFCEVPKCYGVNNDRS